MEAELAVPTLSRARPSPTFDVRLFIFIVADRNFESMFVDSGGEKDRSDSLPQTREGRRDR